MTSRTRRSENHVSDSPALSSSKRIIVGILVGMVCFAAYSQWESLSQSNYRKRLENQIIIEKRTVEKALNEYKEDLEFYTGSRNETNNYISYALYGFSEKYLEGALRNAERAPYVFHGWKLRFYACIETYKRYPQIMKQLRDLGAEIVTMDVTKSIVRDKMCWRFLIADDPIANYWVIRDTDSRTRDKDYAAVLEWIRSGKILHIMRDSLAHVQPIMGGLWGGTKGIVPPSTTMEHLLEDYYNRNHTSIQRGYDQKFLEDSIWSRLQNQSIQHDAWKCIGAFKQSISYPLKRLCYEISGLIYSSNDEIERPAKDVEWAASNHGSPKECRRKLSWFTG